MSNTASLKKEYQDRIVPALTKEFGYKSVMQVPVLKKIVINQGLGMATADKKIIDIAISELSTITGQKAVATVSKKDISNFKLRKKMPIGVMVTLRREQMYEFLERLVRVALPRIRDFKGIESKLDGRGNYTLGIQEQIIFPEINIDNIMRASAVSTAPCRLSATRISGNTVISLVFSLMLCWPMRACISESHTSMR